MRVLVTGGSGFVGRQVVARLTEHHEVLAPTHAELDLSDAGAVGAWLRANPLDAVVHASVKPGHRNAPDPTGLLQANLLQFFGLVHHRDRFGRFVIVGSGAAYGVQRSLVRVSESSWGEVVPSDEHGLSKFVEGAWAAGDGDTVELRPFGVYGPGEDYTIRFVSNACCKALLGMPVTLRQDRRFSYVWVEDLAEIVELSLGDGPEALAPGAYNVTAAEPVSLRSVADLAVAASGNEVSVLVAEPGIGPEYSGDGTRLRSAAPGVRLRRIEQGIALLADWYRERLGTLDRAVLETDR